MTNNQPSTLGVRLLRPIVLAACIGLAAGGCSTMPGSSGGPLDSLQTLSSKLGLDSEQAALRKKVEADRFPEAGPDGL